MYSFIHVKLKNTIKKKRALDAYNQLVRNIGNYCYQTQKLIQITKQPSLAQRLVPKTILFLLSLNCQKKYLNYPLLSRAKKVHLLKILFCIFLKTFMSGFEQFQLGPTQGVKTRLAVCLAEIRHKNMLVTIGQFCGLVLQAMWSVVYFERVPFDG